MGEVSSEDMLQHLIEARGVTQAEVASGTGIAESALSEMLAGKRNMGRKTIQDPERSFRVDPGLFLRGGAEDALSEWTRRGRSDHQLQIGDRNPQGSSRAIISTARRR